MGYFSNGTEGELFKERYCYGCQNLKEDEEFGGDYCPILDLHLLWNYDAVGCNADQTKKMALDHFIRRDKNGDQSCQMYLPRTGNSEYGATMAERSVGEIENHAWMQARFA